MQHNCYHDAIDCSSVISYFITDTSQPIALCALCIMTYVNRYRNNIPITLDQYEKYLLFS